MPKIQKTLSDLKEDKENLYKEIQEKNNENEQELIKETNFYKLLWDLEQLCQCPASNKLIKDPTSVPSGKVYSKDIAVAILKGKLQKFKEDMKPNVFRSDFFTKDFIKIINKYKNLEEC